MPGADGRTRRVGGAEGSARQRDGSHRDRDLVERSGVEELAREIAPADDPHVALAGCCADGGQRVGDRPAHEAHIGFGRHGQFPRREHEGRAVAVELGPLLGMREEVGLGEDPLVGRRPLDHDGRRRREEPLIRLLAALDREQPGERVALVGDPSVDRRGGVEEDLSHAVRLGRASDAARR
jgi:hypothetical protein